MKTYFTALFKVIPGYMYTCPSAITISSLLSKLKPILTRFGQSGNENELSGLKLSCYQERQSHYVNKL